ncbi:MAG: beta strand repeat-containing protein [Jatrophihabitantaceae bacterium]
MNMRSGSKRWFSVLRVAVLATVAAVAGALLLDVGQAFAASNVSSVSFAGATQAASTSTTWTIGFTTSQGQGALNGTTNNNKIFVTFDPAFTIAATPAISLGTGFSSCTATGSTSAAVVTITLAGTSCSLGKGVAGQLTIASIINPVSKLNGYAAANFSVSTSNDGAANPPSNIIIFGAAAKLAFTTQPATATGGSAFGSQPVVAVQDANGNTVATNTSSVTLTLTGGTSGAALSCTTNPLAASSGVAAFAGCKIDKAGTGYLLTATDGALTSAVSSAFAVTVGAANKVVFSVQPPATGTAGSVLTTFRAAVQDAGGNTVTTGIGATDAITLSIATGPVGGVFNSATTTYTNVVASAGVASFTAVVLNTAGSYAFTATDTTRTLTTATSTPATAIGAAAANKLAFSQGPAESLAGAPLTPTVTVQVQDQFGNAVSATGVAVALSSSAGPLSAGASATTNAAGQASFGSAEIDTAATGLTLTATAAGLTSATSATFNVVVLASNNTPLTDTAADTGSGVKNVSYFYCAGYTGSCTSANWTLIGSATSAASNYLVSWTGQPVNGQYRLVAVATDNVTNASSPSASIPVRVAN